MRTRCNRFKNNFIFFASKFIENNKIYLLVFFIVFLFAFITGILTCSNYASVVTHENIINKHIINLLNKDTTYLGFFLWLSFYFVCYALSVIFLTKNTFFVIVDIIIFSLFSYIFGFDICIIILSFGLAGVIYGTVVLGVLGVLSFIVLTAILSVATKRYFITKKSCDINSPNYYIRLNIGLICIGVLLIFIMSILFSSIHIFVIVE